MNPKVIIEPVHSLAQLSEVVAIQRAVFEQEMGLSLPPLRTRASTPHLHLLARDTATGRAVGVLTAVETTSTRGMHQRFALPFPKEASAVRYTRMAVLPAYRGQNLPLRLVFEAWRLFTEPRGIKHSWLVFESARAASSAYCRLLGYRVGSALVQAEYGQCRVLTRDEFSSSAARANKTVAEFLASRGQNLVTMAS